MDEWTDEGKKQSIWRFCVGQPDHDFPVKSKILPRRKYEDRGHR